MHDFTLRLLEHFNLILVENLFSLGEPVERLLYPLISNSHLVEEISQLVVVRFFVEREVPAMLCVTSEFGGETFEEFLERDLLFHIDNLLLRRILLCIPILVERAWYSLPWKGSLME